LAQLVDQLGRQAEIYLGYLAVVGGSAWKMEALLDALLPAAPSPGAL
jgi:pyruvate,water dikinase